ncbi:MAG: sodium/solute symporter [Sedimentisphaeraceae bacterium JB056]
MEIHQSVTNLDYTVIIIYILSVITIGFWVSFRKKESDDIFLAGRSLGWPNIGLSIFGTNIAPSMMIGSCGVAYSTGMVASNFEWLAWPFLMLMAMVFLPHYINTKVSTMPQFMLRRYGNKCRNFLSWYAVFTTCVSLGTTLYAGGVLLGQILGWSLIFSIIFLTVIATSFTVAGGLEAVVITDSFQSILMIVASAALTVIGLYKVGGISELVGSVPPDYWQLFRPADDASYPWPAIVFGYPVMGIWFWCTNQIIVQRALGGRDVQQGQYGSIFASYLKILTPLIFFVPGIICKVLHPDLIDPDQAYMTMVTTYLPSGMVGLIIAVLIAALVSTVDSQQNSLSTVFTLDIYCKLFRPDAGDKEAKFIGRVVTAVSGVVAVVLAILFGQIKDMDLFSLIQSMIAFMAPSMAVVFLVGVLWKRANSQAAFTVLVFGNIVSIGIGVCYLAKWPTGFQWPHFLMLSFYLFVGLVVLMIAVSLLTVAPSSEYGLPTLRETYSSNGHSIKSAKTVWFWWIVLLVIMTVIYIIFR